MSEKTPDAIAQTSTPAMYIVDANGTRKFQPHTKLY